MQRISIQHVWLRFVNDGNWFMYLFISFNLIRSLSISFWFCATIALSLQTKESRKGWECNLTRQKKGKIKNRLKQKMLRFQRELEKKTNWYLTRVRDFTAIFVRRWMNNVRVFFSILPLKLLIAKYSFIILDLIFFFFFGLLLLQFNSLEFKIRHCDVRKRTK